MTRAVVVHDPDGLNPYGRELAGILSGHRTVVLVLAKDAEWVPQFCRVHTRLPGNRGGRAWWRQAASLLLGTATTAWYGGARRHVVVVAWSRSLLEDVIFALLAMLRVPVAVVVHNPVPRVAPTRARRWSTGLLVRAATWRVTHGPGLAVAVEQTSGRAASVCAHPPYRLWWDWASRDLPPRTPHDRVRLLVLGQLRADKGLSDLQHALGLLDAATRRKIVLCVCGKRATEDALAPLAGLVELDDRTSTTFISDRDLARALRDSDLIVAPMTMTTQSGTVILGLSAHRQVLAYRGGELALVLTEAGLVEAGDTEGLAERLRSAVSGGVGGVARRDLESWAADCARQWSTVLGD
jgi:glycosyltransferase involved in cell wall biosynthesis